MTIHGESFTFKKLTSPHSDKYSFAVDIEKYRRTELQSCSALELKSAAVRYQGYDVMNIGSISSIIAVQIV